MRLIGTIEDKSEAQRFGDFLTTVGIDSLVEHDSDGWVVWVHDEDQVDQAREELQSFRDDPQGEKYVAATAAATKIREEQKQRKKSEKVQTVDVRDMWERPALSECPVTMGLIILSVLVAAVVELSPQAFSNRFQDFLSFSSAWNAFLGRGFADIANGQIWRLVTPIFLHARILPFESQGMGFLHLLFNMLWMRELGTVIEKRRGSWRLLVMVLVIAVTSDVAQYLHHGPNFRGMSGVVYGLFGYIWIKSRIDPGSGFYMHSNLVFFMMGWFVLCLLEFIPNVANMAHAAGLIAGILIAVGSSLLPKSNRG